MIFVSHEKYPYSPMATLLSQLNLIAVAILFIATFVSGIMVISHFSVKVLVIFLVILAITLADVFVYNDKILPKLAAREMEKCLRKKQNIALKYCQNHPEEFNRIIGINPKFASRYEMDGNGNIVKKNK